MEAMDWAEVKKRLLDGTSVQILADLNGVTYKTMYNRIMAHQVKDGVTYLTPKNTKGLKKAKAISKTKQAQAKAKEKAAGIPEDMHNSDLPTCKDCAHCMQRNFHLLCAIGHECGENCVCSDYKTFPAPEKKPSAPEDPGKLPELPEDINDETLAAVLKDISREHAEAVKTLHEHEEMLAQAQKSERELRTLLIAMEQLTMRRIFPEVDL